MPRWSTLPLADTAPSDLATVPDQAVADHVTTTLLSRPTYRSLYRTWDRQHWSAEDLDLRRDADNWQRLPAATQGRLERLVVHFLIGEYTGLDLLGPILGGAPDEGSLVFLGTQVGDESRHTRLLDRIVREILGVASTGLRPALDYAWKDATPAQRELSALESRLISALTSPGATDTDWLRAVAVFHVVTEGVLALASQRRLIATLRRGGLFPGLRAGFVAMARDESRHVAFGVEAVRRGLAAGTPGAVDAVTDVLGTALRLALLVELPADPTPVQRTEAAVFAEELSIEAHNRLRVLGLPPQAIAALHRELAHGIESLTTAPPTASARGIS